ncbi:alpha/beta hydrolase [Fredinandcohnia sp. SECRCQ15]|uniref:Alpha/beta hydrolase n=2 Tax=Fredinandcohnia quinoae TaxID=2918902 RepID=A0AAW5DYU0_9BACI|nr:alpha/beta hydrolase [Fredinandcohnia sp. SECRCQ15]MCH1625816.1 alpha/beta hydrolase [Fredinandcohnia sp. SECRCQ15]
MVRQLANEVSRSNPQPRDETITISDQLIPGPEGAEEVRVRIYEPIEKKGILPGLLWIHGGGYVMGTPDSDDALCQRFVSEAECIVVSVDYRLAPEHPYPVPLEDCYAALTWFADHAYELGVDVSRIGVAGASAGGGLTAALTLLARDRKGPHIVFQMPLYPMIDHRNITPSSIEITDHRVWNRDYNIKAWELYLGAKQKGEVSPYASPALAADLSGLPPTYTCIGTLDPFRDETINYVARLSQAGVTTEFHLYPGCYHGFELGIPDAEVSQRALKQYVEAMKLGLQ